MHYKHSCITLQTKQLRCIHLNTFIDWSVMIATVVLTIATLRTGEISGEMTDNSVVYMHYLFHFLLPNHYLIPFVYLNWTNTYEDSNYLLRHA